LPIAKLALLVEYEGTRYHGFQIQPNVSTVQGELERALWRLTGEWIRIVGASRTDAGVHAQGQVVVFKTCSALSPNTFVRALNSYLPQDIAIKACSQVGDDFNPRRQATRREYRYSILNGPTPSPLQRRHAYFVFRPLDIEAMNRGCQVLIGKHDFASFTSPVVKAKNTVRTVFQAEAHREGELVLLCVAADSFLPQQVRRTVSPLIEVGSGRMAVEEFGELTKSKILGLAAPAPPHGLCLMRIDYPNLKFENS
jgi:tRNA pseudouridine38-40 synthase